MVRGTLYCALMLKWIQTQSRRRKRHKYRMAYRHEHSRS